MGAPVDVPMSAIMLAGTGLWGVGLVVSGVAWGTGHVAAVVPTACLCAVVLGVATMGWLRRRPQAEQDPG